MTHATVPVDLAQRSYEVLIGNSLLAALGDLVRKTLRDGPSHAFVVADTGLPPNTVAHIRDSLVSAGFEATVANLAPSERGKSMESLGVLLERLCATAHERTEPVVALGGGVVGDVAGLVAALYRRGVPVVQCPTTLLAMVDASVGGKTAVNLGTSPGEALRKNMAGVFHQPALVVADIDVLESLPDREFRCGLGECVKHAMLSAQWDDPGLFEWLEGRGQEIIARDGQTICELVRRNVAIKARVVAADEHEIATSAGRALLNLGHTFAHAIEPLAGLSPTGVPSDAPLLHGEAVSLGLSAACSLGVSLGTLSADDAERVRGLLGALGLPVEVAGLPRSEDLLDAMGHDKKVARGRIRLVVPAGLGRCAVLDDVPESEILAAIDSIRRT